MVFHNTVELDICIQGYSDMAEKKVADAVSKLEADGLSVSSCQKFLNLYGR
jgi:hypothetical protein